MLICEPTRVNGQAAGGYDQGDRGLRKMRLASETDNAGRQASLPQCLLHLLLDEPGGRLRRLTSILAPTYPPFSATGTYQTVEGCASLTGCEREGGAISGELELYVNAFPRKVC